jgi:hypothetical protein
MFLVVQGSCSVLYVIMMQFVLTVQDIGWCIVSVASGLIGSAILKKEMVW